MEVRIRACGPGDAARLSLVAQASFLEAYVDALPVADVLAHCRDEHGEAAYAAWLEKPAYRLWIAEVAETEVPVGYAMLAPPDLPMATDEFDVELKRIYLLHRFHGSGVGARLMATAVDAARAGGFRRLLLGVYAENHKAMSFYGRQGFTPAGVRQFQVGANLYDDLVLARPIEAGSAREDAQGEPQRQGETQA